MISNEETRNPDEAITRALSLDEEPGWRSRKWKFLLIAVLLVVVGGGGMAVYGQNGASVFQYKTSEAKQGSLAVKVTATGTLQPINQVVVGSELSGTIAQVNVDFNDPVRQGQILAQLNVDQVKTRVAQARATLAGAEAKLQEEEEANFPEVRHSFERCKKLVAQGLCPPQKFEVERAAFFRSKAKFAGAKAQVDHAKATLEAVEMDTKKTVIRSPIDGIILKRNIEPGQTVAASFQTPDLFTIADDLHRMELHVDVDEADVGRVREGQHATFTVDAHPKLRFPAQIKQLRYAPQRVDGVVSYMALLSVENPDLLLRPGMTATADIVIERVEDAVLVPKGALRFTPPDPNKKTSAKSGGSVLAASMPWHSRRKPTKKPTRPKAGADGNNRVWFLNDGKPTAIPIVIGVTDGRMTAVVKGDIRPGTELLIDVLEKPK